MENKIAKPSKSFLREWSESIVIAVLAAFVIRTLIFSLYTVPSGSAEPTILVGDKIWGNKMIYFFQKPQHGELVIFDNPEVVVDKTNSIQRFWQRYVGIPIPIIGLRSGPENVVKRVIAVPGDTIEGRVENGKPVIYLNGMKLDEPYTNPYPLIRVQRMKGFTDSDYYGPSKILDLLGLRYMADQHLQVCTYVPDIPLDQQPYYKLNQDNVIRDPFSGSFMLIPPHTPTNKDVFGPIVIPQGKYWLMGDSRNNSHDARWFGLLDESEIHGRASFIILSIDTSESFFLYDLIKHPIDFWTKHIRWNRFLKGLSQYYGRPDLNK